MPETCSIPFLASLYTYTACTSLRYMYTIIYCYFPRIVRLTSPKLNYIIVVAVLFLCLAGILYPFPATDVGTMEVLCMYSSMRVCVSMWVLKINSCQMLLFGHSCWFPSEDNQNSQNENVSTVKSTIIAYGCHTCNCSFLVLDKYRWRHSAKSFAYWIYFS